MQRAGLSIDRCVIGDASDHVQGAGQVSGSLLSGVQRRVRRVVGRAGVAAAARAQLDPAQVLDVAQSSSSSVWQAAGSRIRKRIGPPCSRPSRRRRACRRRSPSPRTACERDRDVEVVAVGVQGQVVGLGTRPGLLEEGSRVTPSPCRLGWNRETSATWARLGEARQVRRTAGRKGCSTRPSIFRITGSSMDLTLSGRVGFARARARGR